MTEGKDRPVRLSCIVCASAPLDSLPKYVTIRLHMTAPTAYKAIADDTRRQILDLLRGGSLPAGEIAQRFSRVSRPAVSKHLSILRRSRLVVRRREGRQQVYSLNAEPLRAVEDWVRQYEVFWDRQLEAFKKYVESDQPKGE